MTFYNQHSTALVGAAGQPQDHLLEDSLRFRSSASAYLSRTFPSAGNQKTWTWSGWAKRGKLLANQDLFSPSGASPNQKQFRFDNGDGLVFYHQVSATVTAQKWTTALFRDVSAWYHIVLQIDTTNATAADRIKIYVNGSRITSFSLSTDPALNADLVWNSATTHYIGNNNSQPLDGYLTEVNFIDGQALDPSYFGETDTVTGGWKPIKYTGSYGTNGFYLPMTPTSQAEGFNSILYYGHPSNSAQSIDGVGFSPDLVWIKSRVTGYGHCLSDSVRGATKRLQSDTTGAEATSSTYISSLDADGFSLGTDYGQNAPNEPYVAWCWDAGSGSPASNTDGSITSTVKANQAKGFSIATFTGNGSNGATIGHGLGVAPEFVMLKNRSNSFSWLGWNSQLSGNTYRLDINSTGAQYNDGVGALQGVSSSTITLGSGNAVNQSAASFVVYSFASISGYSKIGSYTGNGSSSGPTITTGFKPAWLLVKCSTSAYGWQIVDLARSPSNPMKNVLFPHASAAEDSTTGYLIADSLDNGFQITSTNNTSNQNGQTYIYMAIADTRDTAFNNDASGNKNNWTPNNINSNASGQSTYDLMKDVPTLTDADAGNFATLNPIDSYPSAHTFAEANLKVTFNSGTWRNARATMRVSSGKWYWETVYGSVSGAGGFLYGVGNELLTSTSNPNTNYAVIYNGITAGTIIKDGSTVNTGTPYTAGDIMGLALDVDTGTVAFYKNNSLVYTVTSITGNEFYPIFSASATGATYAYINFGQRPFSYTPPSGFKALNTYNLPTPTIKDGSKHFDVRLWSADVSNPAAGDKSILLDFQPDLVWSKNRDNAEAHYWMDSVRGNAGNKWLRSNAQVAEGGAAAVGATDCYYDFNSNGFDIIDTNSNYDEIYYNGRTYVGWCWKGGNTSGVSNTDGSITSTVSANPTGGFSVVTYTGTGANATVGHGLGIAPSMVIYKKRNAAYDGCVYHSALGPTQRMILFATNGTLATATDSLFFNNTAPTSTTLSLGTRDHLNGSSQTYVAWCFAPIEGYSAFGKYTGNGSTDGPFVYTGFRPAFVLIKASSVGGAGYDWFIHDTSRDSYNQCDKDTEANLAIVENQYGAQLDIISNGFKIRNTGGGTNANGATFIYAAFAENPFKYSLAR